MHAENQAHLMGLPLCPGPTSLTVDAHVGRLQPEMPGDGDRRCVFWVHMRDEGTNAALAEPCENTARRLRCISQPLIAGRDHPCKLGGHPLARAVNRRLDGTDDNRVVSFTNNPVQPTLLAIGGLAHNQPRVPAAELLQRLGLPAGELVQAPVVKQRCHLLGVRNAQRLDDQARSLDQRGARPSGRGTHRHTVLAARKSTARARRAESPTQAELLRSCSVIGSRPWGSRYGLPAPSVADLRTDSFKVAPLPSPRPRARFRVRPQVGVLGSVNHRIPTRREPKMSASAPAVNVVTLVGNLTADPVIKQINDDRRVCNLRIAVNDQKDQPPMFIDVATFGAQADACAKYLTKGRAVAVTGRLVYREWDDNGTRRSRHHIVGRVQFGGKPEEPNATETADTNEEVATF